MSSHIIERPDSRYSDDILAMAVAEGDSAHICFLDSKAERMAFFPSETPGLNDEWKAAYERTQAALMTIVANRRKQS